MLSNTKSRHRGVGSYQSASAVTHALLILREP